MDYQKEYIKNNPDLHNKDIAAKTEAIEAIIKKNGIKLKSIIDIGCGSGAILLNLISSCNIKKSCGVDISEIMIETAIKKDRKNLTNWIKSDIFEVNFNNYDLVLAIDIVEHIENDIALLNKIITWGNLFIIKIPIENNYVVNIVKFLTFGIIDSSKETEKKYGHIHHYSEKEFIKIIKSSGYEILDKEYVHLPKRHKLFWEIIRLLIMPLWPISRKAYIRLNGGFLILLLKPAV